MIQLRLLFCVCNFRNVYFGVISEKSLFCFYAKYTLSAHQAHSFEPFRETTFVENCLKSQAHQTSLLSKALSACVMMKFDKAISMKA